MKQYIAQIRKTSKRRLAITLALLGAAYLFMEGLLRLVALYSDARFDSVSDASRSGFTLGLIFSVFVARILPRPVAAVYRRLDRKNSQPAAQ